jgi:coiled-coil domain-containing protein 130
MAERKAVNKYYPPDWEASHGSLNHYVKHKGGHVPSATTVTTTTSASNTVQTAPTMTGTRRIRFELPMPIWCQSCGRHIAKNVRFNADKKQVGWYHTTPILQFAIKCPSCPQQIVVESVPERTEYKVVEGAQEKTESRDDAGDGTDTDVGYKTVATGKQSAFARVEQELVKKERAEESKSKLESLLGVTGQIWENDFAASQLVRRQFRERKRRERRGRDCDPVGTALCKYGIERSNDTDQQCDRNEKISKSPFDNW